MLAGLIGLVMGEKVTLVSSADETAKEVYRVLTEANLLRLADSSEPDHRFLSTGDQAQFARAAQNFLGRAVPFSADSAATVGVR
jgi:glutamate racemase